MTQPLTDPQQRVLDFIRDFRLKRDFSPTVREITDACGWTSLSTAQNHLNSLERKGWITRWAHHDRTIAVVGQPFQEGLS